jgi:hypothetical protein
MGSDDGGRGGGSDSHVGEEFIAPSSCKLKLHAMIAGIEHLAGCLESTFTVGTTPGGQAHSVANSGNRF